MSWCRWGAAAGVAHGAQMPGTSTCTSTCWIFCAAATLQRDNPDFLKLVSDFHLGLHGAPHGSDSLKLPGKADPAVHVQDQEHT